MDKYKLLIDLINQCIEQERENQKEAAKSAGVNCCGSCMAMGAIDAYRQVLSDIGELTQEVGFND